MKEFTHLNKIKAKSIKFPIKCYPYFILIRQFLNFFASIVKKSVLYCTFSVLFSLKLDITHF